MTIKATCAAFARHDLQVLSGAFAVDVEWREADGNPLADWNPYIGAQVIGDGIFGRLLGAIDGFTAAPDRFVDGGDDVIVLGRCGSTMKQGGASLDSRSCHAARCAAGRIVSFQQYTDSAQWARLIS